MTINPHREAGYLAHKAGARRSANTHRRHSAAWHEWSAGWYDYWHEAKNPGTPYANREASPSPKFSGDGT